MSDVERSSGHEQEVRQYYNHSINEGEAAAGAGFIWFLGRDHLSPMLSNDDELALHTSRWREGVSQRVMELLGGMSAKAGDIVLDIGSGLGGPGRDLAREVGCSVIGVNLSDLQLCTHRKLSEEWGSSYMTGINADVQILPIRTESIDHAFSINMLYHIPRPTRVFDELHRVLKPGGTFAFEDWFTTSRISQSHLEKLRINWSSKDGFHNRDVFISELEQRGFTLIWTRDHTEEAGQFLTGERFGKVYNQQLAPQLADAFPRLWQYEGYKPEHAMMAVNQLRSDILFMGALYRNGEALYQQFIVQKTS